MTSAKEKAASHIVDYIRAQWEAERPDLDLSRLLLAIYLQRLGLLIDQDFTRYCQTHFKMRASDMRLLLALRRARPPYAKRPTDLFRMLLVTSGAITKQVDRLEKRRLVKRRPDPSYGGGFLVQLNDRGRKLVDEVLDGLSRGTVAAPAMWRMPEQDRLAMLRLSHDAIARIEKSMADNGLLAKPTARKKAARAS